MPQRRVVVPEIGEIILSKRRGAKNLRLSITARGQIRVSMPSWTPYAAGLAFAKSRSGWIIEHTKGMSQGLLSEGMPIGKAHRLHFRTTDSSRITTRVTTNSVDVITNRSFNDQEVQQKARVAAEKALKAEAINLLPQRLQTLARLHNFDYKEVKVRKLTSRWGSCAHNKTISLSYYLIQLPWDLIDYVILHELVHTEHLNHGPKFWQAFEAVLPDARKLRKNVNQHKPRLETT